MKPITKLWMILLLLGHAPAFAAETPATEAPKAGPGQIGEDSDYVVGPGDGLQIFVWRNPELTITARVRPDGKISVPPVEELKAVGNTPSQLARHIEQRLAEYIKTPQVTVIITDAQSEYSKITVIGQVREPRAVPYHQGMTAMDIVLRVGGLGDFAAGNKAKIIRKDASGKEKEIPVKLADLINKGRISENVPMKPGDILIVPESRF
jgi:polysaccharide export outer membrane protein